MCVHVCMCEKEREEDLRERKAFSVGYPARQLRGWKLSYLPFMLWVVYPALQTLPHKDGDFAHSLWPPLPLEEDNTWEEWALSFLHRISLWTPLKTEPWGSCLCDLTCFRFIFHALCSTRSYILNEVHWFFSTFLSKVLWARCGDTCRSSQHRGGLPRFWG